MTEAHEPANSSSNDAHAPRASLDSIASSDGRDPLDALAEEFIERRRRGERPPISEYTSRRPELASEIAALFPALMDIEDAGKPETPQAGAQGSAPSRLGDYQVLREVARGGMGIVYEAQQISLGRRVALKVLSYSRLGDERLVERFRREARSAACLHHSNIVPVYGTGEADGALFYAMQFIDGRNLSEVLEEVRRQRATLKQRDAGGSAPPADGGSVSNSAASLTGSSSSTLDGGHARYFQSAATIARQTAEALAYAHGEGVLHRDIKPSNLLLDSKGNVWVTDFGLAKAEGSTELTHTGDVVGTIAYLAPERLDGWSDPRSDVYSLGVTLYEMVTLRKAFPQSTRPEILQAIARKEPVQPRKVDPSIPRDLETIVLKAIDKNPAYRYGTAREMAEDLGRFLEIRPIQAKRRGTVHRAWRWCQRSPYTASFAATSFALLVLLAAGATVYSFRVTEERNKAAEGLLDARIASARWRRQAGWAGQRFESLRELQEVATTRKGSEVATEAVACFGRFDFAVENQHPLDHWSVAMDPRLETYAVGQGDGSVAIRRLEDASVVSRIPPATDPSCSINAMRYSPSGALLAIGLEGPRGFEVRVVELAGQRELLRSLSPGPALALDFEPGERRVAVRSGEGTIAFLSLRGAESGPSHSIPTGAHVPAQLEFDPSGKRLASLEAPWVGSSVLIWDVAGARVEKILVHGGCPLRVAWHPSGNMLAVGCADYLAYLWDVESERIVKRFAGHRAEVVRVAFSPDGETLATASWDGESRFWDVGTRTPLVRGIGHFVAWGPDGQSAGYTIGSRQVGKWRIAPGDEVRRLRFPGAVKGPRMIAVSPEGDVVAAACDGVQVALVAGGGPWKLSSAPALDVAFLPNGLGLLVGADRLYLFPVEREGRVVRFREPRVVLPAGGPLAVAADGRFLACANAGGGIVLADLEMRTEPRALARIANVSLIKVSRGGRYVAVGSRWPAAVQVIDGQTGAQVQKFSWGGGHLAFSPDDRWLFACAFDATYALEVGTWKVAWSRPRQEGGDVGGGIAFLDDARFVLSATSRVEVALYEAAAGREIVRFGLGDQPDQNCVASSGSTLAISSQDYVQLWDLTEVDRELRSLGLDLGLAPRQQPSGQGAVSIELPPRAEPLPLNEAVRPGWMAKADGLTVALQADPGSAEAYERRAEAFLEGGRRTDALVDLARALERKPKQPARVHLRRAQVLERLGQLAECLEDLNRSLELEPPFQDARRLRASVLDRSGREAEAMADWERVITESPGDPVAYEAMSWILLTGPVELRDPRRALDLARAAVAKKPDAVVSQRTLGVACYRAGLLDEARAVLEKALALPGGDSSPSSWLFLAMARARSGDIDGARHALGKGTRRAADPARWGAIGPVHAGRLEEIRAEAAATLDAAASAPPRR